MLDGKATTAARTTGNTAFDSGDGMDELRQQFDAALQDLQNDPALDPAMRETLRQQFAQAMKDVASGESTLAALPDRAMWMDAVQALQASGAVGESEVNELIRQVNQALQPLQRRESQLAIEFSRRIQTEGQEKALAWFREETGKASAESTKDATPPPPHSDGSPLLRSEVVNSRSRHLRGPPQQK